MGRRRRNKSIIESVFTGGWKESAFLALILFVVTFVFVPILNNPILKTVSSTLMPSALIVISVLILISAYKFFSQERPINIEQPIIKKSASFKPSPIIKPYTATSHIEPTIDSNTSWSLKLIQDIEWKRFEEVATAFYVEKGIRAEATTLGADGGIDIKLYQDDSGNATSLVQCKAWYNKQVGVKEIREFLGVLTHEKIAKGFYMTSGIFSEDAILTAKANRINLINGEMFLLMIQRLSAESQKKLLVIATEGNYKTPSCSKCGIKMIRRKGGRVDFWGCSNFPRCRQKLNVKKL